MPRKPRFFLSHAPNHVVQRGRNRDAVFFESTDYYFYLDKLREALDKYQVCLHAYVLMTNHVHLLMSSINETGISQVMQYVGRYYVPYINHKYGYSGSLWEGRFKSSLVDSEAYLLACMRYIELNPVRAGMVDAPANYLHSSYHANALGCQDALITPHAEFLKLSDDAVTRQAFYAELCQQPLSNEVMTELKSGYRSGTPVGSDRFKVQIEATLDRKVGQSTRGRPKKQS